MREKSIRKEDYKKIAVEKLSREKNHCFLWSFFVCLFSIRYLHAFVFVCFAINVFSDCYMHTCTHARVHTHTHTSHRRTVNLKVNVVEQEEHSQTEGLHLCRQTSLELDKHLVLFSLFLVRLPALEDFANGLLCVRFEHLIASAATRNSSDRLNKQEHRSLQVLQGEFCRQAEAEGRRRLLNVTHGRPGRHLDGHFLKGEARSTSKTLKKWLSNQGTSKSHDLSSTTGKASF